MEEIEIDLEEETLFQLLLEAHRRDITLNKLVEEILLKEIERHESKSTAIND